LMTECGQHFHGKGILIAHKDNDTVR